MKNKFSNIYFLTTLIFCVSILLNYLDWQLSGYLTEKSIAWFWILLTLIYIIKFWKLKKVRIYFISLISLLFLSIIPMLIPFYGIYFYLTAEEDYQQLELNNNIRIEITRQSALSMPRVYIYEKYFEIFEKNICRPTFMKIYEKVTDNSIEPNNIEIIKAVLITKHTDSIGIEYQILNSKKIIYHKLNNKYGY